MVEFVGRVMVGAETKAFARTGPPLATAADVLAQADDNGHVRLHFSPGQLRKLAKLPKSRGEAGQVIAKGYMEVDVSHLLNLPPQTPVRIGYDVNYTLEEQGLL